MSLRRPPRISLMVTPETVAQLAVTGLVIGCVYALIALGFNVIFNATGVFNFAQGEFVILGGFLYFQGTLWGMPVLPALLFAVLGAAALGGLTQFGVVRFTRGTGAIGAGTSLIAVSFLMIALMRLIWGPDPLRVPEFTPGEAIRLGGVLITLQQAWVVVITVVVVVLYYFFFRYSIAGIGMRAASLNAGAARGVGISVNRMAFFAYVIGCGLAAVGGALLGPIIGVAVGGGFALVIKGFTAVLLGGIGDPRGAIIGGVLLGLTESIGALFVSSGYQEIVPLVVLILVFILRPGGILGVGVSSRA